MSQLFTNDTQRSAEGALADLASFRQFRHLTDAERNSVIESLAEDRMIAIGRWAPKHPDQNNPCISCGRPRSSFSNGSSGICRACYMGKLADFWIEDVVCRAIKMHGFSCDACGEVESVKTAELETAAIYIVNNSEGIVRPVLCERCSVDFKRFCARSFGRGWRSRTQSDLAKMAVAWFAQKVKILADRVRTAA